MARVLVAEDDFEMRAMLVEALRKDGHDVTEVSDGNSLLVHIAVACLPAHASMRVDVIVSDVRMPGCDAFEALERMGGGKWRVPVILMTAFGDDRVRSRAHKMGAILLDKPLSLDALRAEVTRLGARGAASVPPPRGS